MEQLALPPPSQTVLIAVDGPSVLGKTRAVRAMAAAHLNKPSHERGPMTVLHNHQEDSRTGYANVIAACKASDLVIADRLFMSNAYPGSACRQSHDWAWPDRAADWTRVFNVKALHYIVLMPNNLREWNLKRTEKAQNKHTIGLNLTTDAELRLWRRVMAGMSPAYPATNPERVQAYDDPRQFESPAQWSIYRWHNLPEGFPQRDLIRQAYIFMAPWAEAVVFSFWPNGADQKPAATPERTYTLAT